MAQPLKSQESDDEIATFFRAAPGTEILFDEVEKQGALSQRLHQLKHIKKGTYGLHY